MRDPRRKRTAATPWTDPPPDARPLPAGDLGSGFEWHDELGHWCLLTRVGSGAPGDPQAEQARLLLERMDALLGDAGLRFGDVLRTWYFLHDILGWYDGFNRARTRFLEQHGLLDRLPASTAIGLSLESRTALQASLLALRPSSEQVSVGPVPSPRQGSALDYGSAFSRAVEISWPGGKQLHVSGTASIDPKGRTLHAGQARLQAQETFRIAGDLLASRGLGFAGVTRATCYFARPEDAEVLEEVAGRHVRGPISWIAGTLCRPELCFELELVAGG